MKCVVIVGPPGGGKTTLSQLLADEIDYLVVNVGSLLEAQLQHRGIEVASKYCIGPTYLREFGAESYFQLLARAATESDVIVDGLRVFDALSILRNAADVHVIYREPPTDTTLVTTDDYVEDLPRFRGAADVTVPWQEEMGGLLGIARDIGREVAER